MAQTLPVSLLLREAAFDAHSAALDPDTDRADLIARTGLAAELAVLNNNGDMAGRYVNKAGLTEAQWKSMLMSMETVEEPRRRVLERAHERRRANPRLA